MKDIILKPIGNDQEYEQYLSIIDALIDSEDENDQTTLYIVALLVEAYEKDHFPIEPLDPVQVIRFRMEELGLKQKDLIPFMGSGSRVSEVLNGKRNLTLEMIKNLHQGLKIPLNMLVGV